MTGFSSPTDRSNSSFLPRFFCLLVFALFVLNDSNFAQEPSANRFSQSLKVLVAADSGEVVSSSYVSPNAKTQAGLRTLLKTYPGRWRAEIEDGFVKSLKVLTTVGIEDSPKAFSSIFLKKSSGLFGIRASDSAYIKEFDLSQSRIVEYIQEVDNIPVEHSFITFSIHENGLDEITSRVYPAIRTKLQSTSPKVDQQEAIAIVSSDILSTVKGGHKLNTNYKADLVILPEEGSFYLTWKIIVSAQDTLFSYTYYIDALTGATISKYSNIRNFQAQSAVQNASAIRKNANAGQEDEANQDKGSVNTPEGQVGIQAAGDWQTILNENFEGNSFPNSSWRVFDNNGSQGGELYWNRQNCVSHAGSWGIWPAAGGANRLNACSSNYVNNMQAWAVYGPFDLSNATDAVVEFYYRNESEQNYDFFQWMASIDGTNFYGQQVSGNSNGWQFISFDLKNVYTIGNLTGKPRVWIALVFNSDSSVVSGKGPFVDDLVIKKKNSSGCTGVSGHVGGHIYGKNKNELQLRDYKDMKVVLNKTLWPDSYIVTNDTGNYSSTDCPDYVRFELEGYGSRNFLKVFNCSNGPCSFFSPGTVLKSPNMPFASIVNFDWNVGDDHKKEVNVFWHINEMHDWFKNLIGQDLMNYQMQAYVDYVDQQTCNIGTINAVYNQGDKNIYFCPSDVSKESDVIYHEYTHGVVNHISGYSLPYQDQSGAMDEGFADYFAATKNGDPYIGEGIGTLRTLTDVVNFGNQCTRETNSNCQSGQYWLRSTNPSLVNDYGYVHHNSLVPSGSLWDLRQNRGLTASYVDDLVIRTLILRKPLTFLEVLRGLIAQDGGAHESQIRAAFATRGVAEGPVVTSFNINSGASSTTSRTVTLNNSASGSPSHYLASESSTFSGASWQMYSAAPNFTLTAGSGNKTVYFKVKNSSGAESPVVNDSIVLNETGGTLPGAFTLTATPECNGTTTQIRLTWTPSSNAQDYDVYRNGSLYYSNVGGTQFLNTAVSPGVSYSYFIRAKNTAGTRDSSPASATAPTNCGVTLPGAFTLTLTPECSGTTSQIRLNWTVSSNAQTYDVYRNGGLYYSGITGIQFINTAVTPGTSYSYFVRARNTAGTRDSSASSATAPTSCSPVEIIVDDLSSGFSRFGPSQYWSQASIGYNGHVYYTRNNQSIIQNYAIWTPNLSSRGSGTYALYVYIPNNYATTTNAVYTIFHNGVSDVWVVNQAIYFNQWVLLGNYYFSANGNEYVKLTDLTGESSLSKYIGFDAVKWVK